MAPVSLASFFVVLWGPPLSRMSATLMFLSLWLKWGLCLSHFPLLLLRAALGYAAWFNTSDYLSSFLDLQPGSTCVPCATYVFAPGFASLIPGFCAFSCGPGLSHVWLLSFRLLSFSPFSQRVDLVHATCTQELFDSYFESVFSSSGVDFIAWLWNACTGTGVSTGGRAHSPRVSRSFPSAVSICVQ